MRKNERIISAIEGLEKLYPEAICSLQYTDALQLLIATRLSAQCTDKRVNMVTPDLFDEFPTAEKMANAPLERVEELIKTCGLYKTKAKDLIGIAKAITPKTTMAMIQRSKGYAFRPAFSIDTIEKIVKTVKKLVKLLKSLAI